MRRAGGDYGKIGETQSKVDIHCLVPANCHAGIQVSTSRSSISVRFSFFKKKKNSGDFKSEISILLKQKKNYMSPIFYSGKS